MTMSNKKMTIEDLLKKRNVESINSTHISFSLHGQINPRISLFTNVKQITLQYLQLVSLKGLEEMKLEYINVSHNTLTDISSLEHMTTITYLDVENNQLRNIPMISSLKHLNILDNLLLGDKQNFVSLMKLTQLTSLVINPSIHKSLITTEEIEEMTSYLSESISEEKQINEIIIKEKGNTPNLRLMTYKYNYFKTLCSFSEPKLFYCNIYLQFLLLLLKNLKELNGCEIIRVQQQNILDEINTNLMDEFLFMKETPLLTQLQMRSFGFITNI